MRPSYYDLVADEAVAADAERLLIQAEGTEHA
jgi:hypothetical protein